MFQNGSNCALLILQKLETLLSKGKNILQLTTMCSKYETDREKLLTFKALAKSSTAGDTIEPEVMDDFKEVIHLFGLYL